MFIVGDKVRDRSYRDRTIYKVVASSPETFTVEFFGQRYTYPQGGQMFVLIPRKEKRV